MDRDALPLVTQVKQDLTHGGILSRQLPGYEERPAQIEMAMLVAHTLETGAHAIIEAGTGTGKSLAYLLPIVHSKKAAIISTANKALQEQLFYKDIPFIQRYIDSTVHAALVKGMANYVCLDRLSEEQRFQDLVRSPAFARLAEELANPHYDGDLDLLSFALPTDIRRRIHADGDRCAWRSCPFFKDCYVRRMRERAGKAQLIIVNHTLLLLDTMMDGWLLPERDVIIIDEAHHLEEEATRVYTVTVSPGRVKSLFDQRQLQHNVDPALFMAAQRANDATWLRLAARAEPHGRERLLLKEPLPDGIELGRALEQLAESLKYRRPQAMEAKEEQLYDKLITRTRNLAHDVTFAFGVAEPDDVVYYVERELEAGQRATGASGYDGGRRSSGQLTLSAARLDVAEMLRQNLFAKTPVIATSATLAVGGDFSFFRQRVGIPRARERALPLAFDYESQALLYVPHHVPEPAYAANSSGYLQAIGQEMQRLVEAAEGRAFLLFSSFRALQSVYSQIEASLRAQDFALWVQGELPRLQMLQRFCQTPRSVLFGLKSFWEGVDITGEALSLVVIDKLPFAPPDDPVQEARVNRMRAAGEDWFGNYTLPQAILQLKQGLGRLLRARDDRGVLAILDTRLHTKGYGRRVLEALPPARRTSDIADVERFFQGEDTATTRSPATGSRRPTAIGRPPWAP
jgi:Rad3-related DNA helicase